MSDCQPAAPGRPGFVRGNDRLDELLADPRLADDVARVHANAEEMDRLYAMNPGDDPQGGTDDPG
jgi:hypothetical protein